VLIFTRIQHPRLVYAAQQVFRNVQGELRFTDSVEVFQTETGPKWWYDEEEKHEAWQCEPVAILWKNDVPNLRPELKYWNNIPFPDLDGSGRFDPLACTFYMLSRMEEYTSAQRDEHGRFSGHSSWSGPDIVQMAIVDRWRRAMEQELLQHFPAATVMLPTYRPVATIDVDSAFAFRYKGVRRTCGALVLDVLKGKWKQAVERAYCVLANQDDPFDTYDFISDYCHEHRVELKCFFLLANRSRFDINIDFRNEQLQDRILEMRDSGALVGIHPGYRSHADVSILKTEIQRLQTILDEPVHHSRQHFLKFDLPVTYQRLLQNGLCHDYSMGYADVPGFRAGTSFPFPWFDLTRNAATSLLIHPVVVMDSTLNSYLRLSPQQAKETIDVLRNEVRAVGGEFTSLWHNETVAERGIWKGWRQVWQYCLH
jgi:hypothetical protein